MAAALFNRTTATASQASTVRAPAPLLLVPEGQALLGGLSREGEKRKRAALGDIAELSKVLEEERKKLRLFIIKAKQDYEERKEREIASGQATGETDKHEYYTASIGEEFGPDGRYRATAAIGKGVFSSVFQCRDAKDNNDYAIKFIRSNHMMRKAAEKEVEMYRRLEKLAKREDPEGARYLINLAGVGTFEHQGHLCFVFDLLRCDMRFALQKYGQGGGLPLATVCQYARHIFLGLRALRKLNIMHADLKPDNLLMTINKAEVQICDFGSAMDVSEQVRTAYAQPRYYRAPEIMLGVPYDTQIDVWSAGATIFELSTGRILFTGKSNNQMLKQIIDVCGGFPKFMASKGEFSKKHFNADGDFLLKDPDSITGEPDVVPATASVRPARPVRELLRHALAKPAPGTDKLVHEAHVAQLAELVGGCLRPDLTERTEPARALDLPFFRRER